MAQVKAAVCRAFGEPLQLETLDLRAPGPGEVEVTLAAVAICHSDIAAADGAWGGTLPVVLGHEAAGHVSALGAGVQGYAAGDGVLVTLLRACGRCADCASGRPATCSNVPGVAPVLTDAGGAEIAQGINCAAFAERVVVHESQILPLSPAVPMAAASLLSCGVITGVGAVVNDAKLRPGETAVVIGAGGVGLNAVQGARLAGARRVVAVDMSQDKLETARAFGATHGVLGGDGAAEAMAAILPRGADAVFVTVGHPAVYKGAGDYLAPGGRLLAVGMPPTGSNVTYEPELLAYFGQSIIGSRMGNVVLARDIPWMVDLYEQGRLKLDDLVSGRWSLDEINDAIADTKSGAARRNVIVLE
ncbi:MAG: zinc-binding dehydrogenase [Pseudomonadota bacterium]